MFIRYKVSNKKIVYSGDKIPLNVEDGTYAVVKVDSVPHTNGYLTFENGVIIPHNKTPEELTEISKIARINELKQLLRDSDYKAIKYAEGVLTFTEYQPVLNQRVAWRDEINQLEK